MEEEIDWQAELWLMDYDEFVEFVAWLWSDIEGETNNDDD